MFGQAKGSYIFLLVALANLQDNLMLVFLGGVLSAGLLDNICADWNGLFYLLPLSGIFKMYWKGIWDNI